MAVATHPVGALLLPSPGQYRLNGSLWFQMDFSIGSTVTEAFGSGRGSPFRSAAHSLWAKSSAL